jgi:hypothetical protein
VLDLAVPPGDRLVGDLGAAAEEEPPFRLHERVLRAALLEGVHRVDPELPDRVGQQGGHVEEVHDVDRLGEIDPFDRGVGVVHVGDEIADPVELFLPFRGEEVVEELPPPADREVDDLPPPPVVDDAGEPLVVAAVEADLVDAHHLGEPQPRDGRVVGVEEPDRVGFVDPVPPRDGREGLVGEELVPDLGLREVRHGGVARHPTDRRRERPPAGLAGEPHLQDQGRVPHPSGGRAVDAGEVPVPHDGVLGVAMGAFPDVVPLVEAVDEAVARGLRAGQAVLKAIRVEAEPEHERDKIHLGLLSLIRCKTNYKEAF